MTESMDDYLKELDASFRVINEGDLVDCSVVGIADTEVTVDLNYNCAGIITAAEMSDDPGFSVKQDVSIGDTFQAVVLRQDDGRGNLLLSKKRADNAMAWERFAGHLADRTVLDMTIRIRMITVDRDNARLVGSARDVLREKAEKEKARMVSNLQVGLITEGRVESLQSYGAFVSLGNGLDGLVHISRITGTRRLKHPKEMLAVGDTVKVKVVDIKDGKISLSIKDAEDQEAEAVTEETVELPESGALTTSLGSLLKGLKL